jgi:argininosuccinate synthase
VNGKSLTPAVLVQTLNEIGGRHGVGRVDIVENRLVGIKSRGVYETPGGTLLVQALRALETLTLDRDSVHEKEKLAARYAELVYFGQWFSPLREALDAFMNALMPTVTGDVTLKLYKGSSSVVGRTSPHALYSAHLASFDMRGYAPADATGFIRLFGLPTKGRLRLKAGTTYQAVVSGEG